MFKWIFGTIAGAFLLSFFVNFSITHLEGESLIEGNKMSVFIDDKLDALGLGEGGNVLELEDDFLVGFECGSISVGEWEDDNYAERSTDKVIFSGGRLEGDTINMWTQKWEFPYRIVTFNYLSNLRNYYVLVHDAGNSEDVLNLASNIPNNMNFQTVGSSAFNPSDFSGQAKYADKFTFVFFGSSGYTVEQIKNSFYGDVKVEIIEINLDENTGKIYDNYGNSEDVFYLGDEMLYGLMFSGTGYACTKDRAMERFRTITQIYDYKVQRLMGKANEPDCLNLLNEGRKMLTSFLGVSHKPEFYNYFEKIERQNRRLREKSCSTIY